MRLTVVHLGCDRLGSTVGRWVRSRYWGWLGLWLVLFPFPLVFSGSAAPAAAPKPTPRHPNTTVAQSAVDHHQPEMAVVYDDTYHPPAKDLQLNLEAERKADAAAHFIDGLLEEDSNADQASDQYNKSLALDPGNVELSVKLAQDDVTKG